MRNLFAPELKNRIDIHCTGYHEAHDEEGEAWVTIDGKKIFGGGYYHWYTTPIPKEWLKESHVRYGDDDEYYQVYIRNENIEKILNYGIHDTAQITQTIRNYIQTPFEEIVESNHLIYRAFLMIDRRLGKRRFEKINLREDEHPLVRKLYQLRKETFGIKGEKSFG